MTDATAPASPRPTVALVHGAFADSSGWNDVVGQLQAAGIAVRAISNPLRGITAQQSRLGPNPTVSAAVYLYVAALGANVLNWLICR